MQVVTDLRSEIALDDLWQNELGGRAPSPSLLKLGQELLEEARTLVKPVALFDLFSVGKVSHNRIVLSNGTVLRGQDISRFLAPAKEAVVAVVSIGPALEECASRYSAQGEKVRGYLLDCLGTVALGHVVQEMCTRLEASIAHELGYPAGFPISPGDPGWPLDEQRILFNLLPTHLIGVSLTDSCVMLPKKSVSFVLGLGPGMQSAAEGSQCDYCSVRETCRYRHAHAREALDFRP